MLDSRITVAPSALRNPFANAAISAVRAVQPVVGRVAQAPVADRGQVPTSTYTPSSNREDITPLYSRKGAPSTSSGVFASATLDRTDSFDLQVRTAEGDVATLSFSRSSSSSASALAVQADAASAQAVSSATVQSSEAQISVKGALNDQERAAINALAKQVNGVANDFFAGNLDGALQSASQIDITDQAQTLSAYAFSLQSQETRTSAAIYDHVARTTAPLDVRPPPPPATAQAAPAPSNNKDLLQSLLALFERFTVRTQEPGAGVSQSNDPATAAKGASALDVAQTA